ncbi:hypothetical protein VHEMI06007 [[Torrubiella] hemipterigena]|uniref:Uncharacterized protein n=1 Tax=[Torrubiella] hemipterigena TaxID=1531966 RepID=A0A0A1T5Z2_9HYPO|nr:hypothetical protein VHEMI06007 [[Torrubiella] hemipterigena]
MSLRLTLEETVYLGPAHPTKVISKPSNFYGTDLERESITTIHSDVLELLYMSYIVDTLKNIPTSAK